MFGTAWTDKAKAAVGGTRADGLPDPAAGMSPSARAMVETGEPMVATIIMMATAFAFVAEIVTLLGAAGRFVTGADRRR